MTGKIASKVYIPWAQPVVPKRYNPTVKTVAKYIYLSLEAFRKRRHKPVQRLAAADKSAKAGECMELHSDETGKNVKLFVSIYLLQESPI